MNRRSLVAIAVILFVAFAAWEAYGRYTLDVLMNREDIANPVSAKPVANIGVSLVSPVPFQQYVLNDRQGNHKAKVIIDADGSGSVVGAISGPNTFELYRAAGRPALISPAGYVGGDEDARTADFNGDGAPDVVTGGQNFITSVLFNPRHTACSDVYSCPWQSMTVDRHRYSHDIQVGDVNGDGHTDIVTEQGIYFNEKSGRSWHFTGRGLIPRDGQGTTLGVLNADGVPDIVAPYESATKLALFINPRHHGGDPMRDRWAVQIIDAHPLFTGNMTTAITDIKHDGRKSILLAPMYGGGGLVWYEAPSAPGGRWLRHMIDPTVNFVHQGSLKLADFNGNGRLDIAFAEQDQSPTRRVGIFYNVNGDGSKWRLQVLSTRGGHNIKVGVLGKDAYPSIVSARWGQSGSADPLLVWRDLLKGPKREN